MEEPTPKLDEYDEILLKATHEACEVLVPELRRMASVACGPRVGYPRPIPFPTFASARRAQIKSRKDYPRPAISRTWLMAAGLDIWVQGLAGEGPAWKGADSD